MSDSLKIHIVDISFSVQSFLFSIGHIDLTIQQITFDDFKTIFAPLFSLCKIKKIEQI
jgi:hypothetical protein